MKALNYSYFSSYFRIAKHKKLLADTLLFKIEKQEDQ